MRPCPTGNLRPRHIDPPEVLTSIGPYLSMTCTRQAGPRYKETRISGSELARKTGCNRTHENASDKTKRSQTGIKYVLNIGFPDSILFPRPFRTADKRLFLNGKTKRRTFVRHACEPAGARTRDPNIKSVVLYQLSYGFNTCQTVETVFFRFGGANVENIFVLPK